MKQFIMLLGLVVMLTGCGGFKALDHNPPTPGPQPQPEKLFVIATATVDVAGYGDLAKYKHKPKLINLLIPSAIADVAQASGVVSVTYSRPGATSFTLNTASFTTGSTCGPTNTSPCPHVSSDGLELDLGDLSVSALDDNSLRVCTGVGAPGNKCNRLYIKVFTLGSNVSGTITNTAGLINTDAVTPYGIDVLAGSVLTPIGFNSNANAASVPTAATVFTYTIGGSLNRVRLTNTGAIAFPVKADLSNAGSGNYEMRLVVQYALGYQ